MGTANRAGLEREITEQKAKKLETVSKFPVYITDWDGLVRRLGDIRYGWLGGNSNRPLS